MRCCTLWFAVFALVRFAHAARRPRNRRRDFYNGTDADAGCKRRGAAAVTTSWRAWSRNIWARHLPGNPRIVVQNMPGAGGIVAMNYLYTTAPKDGTVIGGVA